MNTLSDQDVLNMQYICTYLDGMPEIKNWKWSDE